tara:strand:- start:11163 stop:12365 length:1203 start_codon:yes stop_codon:yes gene_type:complete
MAGMAHDSPSINKNRRRIPDDSDSDDDSAPVIQRSNDVPADPTDDPTAASVSDPIESSEDEDGDPAGEAQAHSDDESMGDEDGDGIEPAMTETIGDELSRNTTAMTLDNIVEEKVTVYSSNVYGIPSEYIVHRGKPMPFKTADEMNELLNTKAPAAWNPVLTEHITVIRSDDKKQPPDWYKGKPGAPTEEELPYETFLYFNPYVEADPDKPDEVFKMECDKKQVRHLHKQVAAKVHERFLKLKKAQKQVGEPGQEGYVPEHPKRKDIVAILDWEPSRNPQVRPDGKAQWPVYRSMKLDTAYSKRQSQARPKGPQKKKGKNREEVALPPVPKRGFLKRDNVCMHEDVDRDDCDGQASSSNTTAAVDFSGGDKFKRFRSIAVANGKDTHVYIMGNQVHIVEH